MARGGKPPGPRAVLHPTEIPRTAADLLRILGVADEDEWGKIAGILAWAGRQPDTAEKLPEEWHQQLDALGAHPGTKLLETAIQVGKIVRALKFIPMPGSRYDLERPVE